MSDASPPLSPTVASIFSEFLKKLESGKALGAELIKALQQALDEQKLDPETLRNAIFQQAKQAQ
ncbi:hypothetical protein [Bradyrhizobium diazoefficiens]|uniref:hypothetical protein n=1 Tax=Bradyrhizobium diazoefficiens TaxID=1355477 RepID=UPI00272C3D59|nr:hypothetical protein [Bradyrhizobium diazoefficiens]WLA66121.1 hypothetical protein QNN01_04470 [Bradyrhizobium diazoefficiens]